MTDPFPERVHVLGSGGRQVRPTHLRLERTPSDAPPAQLALFLSAASAVRGRCNSSEEDHRAPGRAFRTGRVVRNTGMPGGDGVRGATWERGEDKHWRLACLKVCNIRSVSRQETMH